MYLAIGIFLADIVIIFRRMTARKCHHCGEIAQAWQYATKEILPEPLNLHLQQETVIVCLCRLCAENPHSIKVDSIVHNLQVTGEDNGFDITYLTAALMVSL
jgi:hypothetical protein